MLSIDLPPRLEKQFWRVIQDSYRGDLQTALTAFLWLHEKYGWKEQLARDVDAVRTELKQQGGIRQTKIDEAIRQYRQTGPSRVARV